MISIITTIHNQLPMNRLYYQYLKKYTVHPFELIIIDNASTDGSTKFFREQGVKMIVNEGNYSYPYTQNQGLQLASHPVIAFFNNDLLVSPSWDEQVLKIMKEKKLDVVSFATNDRVETDATTFRLRNKWKWIKEPLKFIFGSSSVGLKLMHRMMYGDWEKWTMKRYQAFGDQVTEGFSGSCIVSTREALNKVGTWDERIQAADFDFYLRTKKRSVEYGDMKPISLLLGIYLHHYGRLTLEQKSHNPFVDKINLISLDEKWGSEMNSLLTDISR